MTKQEYHIVTLSGGKDSTAMLLEMLERDMKIDCILFCDTGLEFPQMYKHLARLEEYVGRPITRIKAEHDFEYYFMHYTPKRKNPALEQYSGKSWAGPRNRWCTGFLKTRVIDAYLKELRENYTVIKYIGIAADEQYRLKRANNQNSNHRHPLVDWGWTERDCLRYCYERGYDWDGLYEHFKRVSCWCCPLQPLTELRELHQRFPELWEQLKTWDKRTWRNFRADYSVEELEVRFLMEREWIAAGKSIKSREFFAELKKRLGREE